MSFFDLVISVSMVATALLLFAGLRGLMKGSIPKNKAILMLVVAVVTAMNLYLWLTMPAIPQ